MSLNYPISRKLYETSGCGTADVLVWLGKLVQDLSKLSVLMLKIKRELKISNMSHKLPVSMQQQITSTVPQVSFVGFFHL